MKEVINCSEASRIIGVPPSVVRFNLNKGIWNFGRIVYPSESGRKQKTYYVNVREMCEYFGIPLEEVRGA